MAAKTRRLNGTLTTESMAILDDLVEESGTSRTAIIEAMLNQTGWIQEQRGRVLSLAPSFHRRRGGISAASDPSGRARAMANKRHGSTD